jgi:hypothetical protein
MGSGMESDELPPELGAAPDELGPTFEPSEPAGAAAAPIELGDALAGGPNWSANRIGSLLEAKGALLHGALAKDKSSTEWLYTKADLAAIAPALARIMNRYPATRAAAAGGDELAVAMGFAGYGARSWSERRAAIALERFDQAAAEAGSDFGAPIEAVPAPAPAPMQTAADYAAAAPEPDWPSETEPPPITGRTR